MTQPQASRVARRARQREQLRSWRDGRPPADPELRRMLTSHIHCCEEMQLVILPGEQGSAKRECNLLTYRCSCGFSFDQERD